MITTIIDGCQLLAVLTALAIVLSLVDRRRYVRRLHRMRNRTECAHCQVIERTSQHLPHERTPEQIASYHGVSIGGID